MLPNTIDLGNIGRGVIYEAAISQIAETAGANYELDEGSITTESSRRVNEWLVHHMDGAPFHKLCYDPSITTRTTSDYLIEHGNDSALQIDTSYGMTPLHMLSMNPQAPPDSIAALLDSNMDAVFCFDKKQKTPLDYARDYNVGGLVGMVAGLCIHRSGL